MLKSATSIEVLYIEDDEGLSSLVEHKLKKQQIDVLVAPNLEQARKLLKNYNFDLVLVDHELPDGTGYSFVQEFSQTIPCVMLTGVGSESLAVKCLKAGVRDYIIKDVKGNYLNLLPNVVTRVLHEQTLAQENKFQANVILQSQERLQAVFDNAPDLMIIADSNLRIIDASAITVENYRTTRDSLKNANMRDFLDPPIYEKISTEKLIDVETNFAGNPVLLRSKRLDSGEYLVVFRNMSEHIKTQQTLKKLHFSEDKNIALTQTNSKLKQVLRQQANYKILGHSQVIYEVEETIKNVAVTDATVLIYGETGTGKELVANAIFSGSERCTQPFITLNCASIPKDLVESELFGHEKGAFTGALRQYTGKFVQADGGTLFLDEIGELDISIQAKLLRVLQEGEVQPVGSQLTKKVDVRFITATNRNLETMVTGGDFRADLFYRLNVVPIDVPPLRERREDIPLLAEFFLRKYAKLYGIDGRELSKQEFDGLDDYPWPGNVRELQNVIERFVVLGHMTPLRKPTFCTSNDSPPPLNIPMIHSSRTIHTGNKRSLAAIEKTHIIQVLEEHDWVISGSKGAAKILGLNPSTLRFRMQKLNISRR